MNDSTRVIRRPRRAWPPTARTAAAIIGAAGLVLPAAACGGSPSSTGCRRLIECGSVRRTNSQLLAFSRCMRSNGVPNFPDPDSSGEHRQGRARSNSGSAAPSSRRPRTPASTCSRTAATGRTRPQMQQVRAQALQFAQCMRSHGVELP